MTSIWCCLGVLFGCGEMWVCTEHVSCLLAPMDFYCIDWVGELDKEGIKWGPYLFCNTTMLQGDATALPASSPKSEGSGYYNNPYDYYTVYHVDIYIYIDIYWSILYNPISCLGLTLPTLHGGRRRSCCTRNTQGSDRHHRYWRPEKLGPAVLEFQKRFKKR